MSTSLRQDQQNTGYLAIAAALRGRIARGELAPREQLPPIQELAQGYRTTAITVRRALRRLEEEGLVRVEHGVGTYVTDPVSGFERMGLPSFAAEMASREFQPETSVARRARGICRPGAAAALGLAPEAPLVLLGRVRRVNGAETAYQESYLPEALGEVVEGYTPDRSLYELLRQATGRIPAAAEERLRAAALPPEIASLFGISGTPVGWIALRTTFDAGGAPLVYDEAYFPAERMELRVYRTARQALLEYELPPAALAGP